MRVLRAVPRSIALAVLLAALTASASNVGTAAAADGPEEAVLLPRTLPFACQMVDDGSSRAWVYCWEGFDPVTRHVKLDVEGQASRTATVPTPLGIGGPGEPNGAWLTIGRFRCEVLRKGVECVAIATGRGFRMSRTEIVEVQQPAGVTAPAPVYGQSATLESVSGAVFAKAPGDRRFAPLIGDGTRVPFGTAIDTRQGTIQLNAAAGAAGGAQTGRFRGGIFRIGQPTSPADPTRPEGLTVLKLIGPLPKGCGRKAGRGGRAMRARGSNGRRLWGDAHGNFQTGGHYASATVAGTKWLTQDTCAGTRVTVARGAVSVHDLVHDRTVLVQASHSFLAHPGPEQSSPSSPRLWKALDGKVICGLAIHAPKDPPERLLCSSLSLPAPKRPSEGDPGFVYLARTGSPELTRLSQYSWEVENGWISRVTLAPGQQWSNSTIGVTCAIGASTVTCTNRSGHGFTIATDSYGAF